jgi:lanthanide-dependent methanol dehydrogenase
MAISPREALGFDIPSGAVPPRQATRALFVCLAVPALAACPGDRPAAEQPPAAAAPVAVVDAQVEEDGQWPMAAKNHASTRYSGLTEINTQNVHTLRLAWTFATGTLRGHEAAPVVIGDRMYLVTPFPNNVYALDTRDGSVIWKYEPETDPASQGVACCDVVNRGVAYDNGRIFFNTLDNYTIALSAATGAELWRTKLGDINRGESMTMAPVVARGLVLVGNSGGEFGVRGWITALNAADGSIAWRAYHTGPDRDVLIGARFRPFYEADRAPDLGVTTWPPDEWRIGGATVWGWISYDAELDLVFYGTANPGAWNPALRPGDNKWSSAIFARDLATGEAVWAYQFTPHDEHDYDAVMENILVELPWQGEVRRLLLRPERNGFVYVMDRETGQVLSAEPYGPVTWAFGVDLETGRPIKNEDKATGNRLARNVCPAAPGMKDWQPSAYSHRTRLLYIPHNHMCMDYEGVEVNYIAGTPYVGASVVMYAAPGDGHRGKFTAWDPLGQRIVWQIDERFPVWSGAVATAGDVVFYGTMDRWFKAVHAVTGELLWQHRVGSGIVGQPVTYLGADGRQYVAIFSGIGGWAGAAALGLLPVEDPTIALGFASAMRDLPEHTAEGGTLYVFALPDAPAGPVGRTGGPEGAP